MAKTKLDINFNDDLEVIKTKIDDWFDNPDNEKEVKKFKKGLEKELKRQAKLPCNTHLRCEEGCIYKMPKNAEMGTICWCKKYKVGQEEQCEKECGKRWTWELDLNIINEEESNNGRS